MVSRGCIPYRPHDYMYDPIFTTSGPADHYKAAMVANMASTKYQLCPVFGNMFSDLQNYPRIQLVQRRPKPIMSYENKLRATKKTNQALRKPPVDVGGKDRAIFFCPVINLPPADFLGCLEYMPRFTIEKAESSCYKDTDSENEGKSNSKDVYVQTVYRESCAQTTPWEPPYKVIGKGDPEILKLEFLKWGSGLPAGMHEVRLIERARMKRAWENTVKPDIRDESSLQRFRDYVEALERDEWAFREMEIQEIQDLRLHLLEKMLEEVQALSHDRAQAKLDNFIEIKEKEKKTKLEKIRRDAARELRQLELQQKGFRRKYYQPDIIEEHTVKHSELYAPLMRHGEHPKRWHQIIDETMQRYKAQFIGVEQFSTLPRWLNKAIQLKGVKPKKQGDGPQLCIRETKWTAPVLKQLHEELLNLRKETEKKGCSLRVRNVKEIEESTTPDVEGISLEQERRYQAVVFMQKLIEGRAAQMTIYEGMENCRELISELKYSVGLLKKQKEDRAMEKKRIRAEQREETIQNLMVSRLQGSLGKLQGQVVGSLLDFLNKELKRLLEERKAHAMCWVNERERNIREAAEAGRRQKEIRRRKEHDEIFKQIVKITQESVDVYLQDIITEGMEFTSKEEATNYVSAVANRIEKEVHEIDKAYAMEGVDDEEEFVADLVHHFVLPEVEKQMVRKKIIAEQKQKLKTIHCAIHRRFDNLPKVDNTQSWPENSVFSSSPTIEHYQYKLEEWMLSHEESMDTVCSTTPLVSTISNPIVKGQEIQQLAPIDASDTLEEYLDMLAKDDINQDETREQPFQIQETVSENKIFRPFNDLDTIPETENEISTSTSAEESSKESFDNEDL